MKKSYKLLISILIFVTLCYTGAWFVASREIKNYFSELESKKGESAFKFKGLNITGFPFNIKIKVEQLNYTNSSLSNAKVEVETESAIFKTNIFFNKISFVFPKVIEIRTILDEKPKSYKIIANGDHEVEIKLHKIFNTAQIISNLRSKTDNILNEIEISSVKHKSDDISLYNIEDNSHILNSKNKLDALFSNNDEATKLEFVFNNNINILDSKKLNIDFNSFNSSFDSVVKYKRKNILSVNEIILKNSIFQVDDFMFEMLGLIKKEKSKLDVDLTIKIDKLASLLAKLTKQNFITLAQAGTIEQLIANITGTNYTNKCEFKIYTSKENEVRFGHLDFNNIINYIQIFMMSK